jgi:hypothetical protein
MGRLHRDRWVQIAGAVGLLALAGGYGLWVRSGSESAAPAVDALGPAVASEEIPDAAGEAAASSAAYPRPGPGQNLLALEASPYLQQHAHNPVDWYPWGEAAFARARREGKPIFLSVGYSTCYWCHVMEREVFSDPEIAALMNAHFVSVKVDREERPDVDDVYMKATQLLTGSGGWPNSVFLTPEGRPFYAGTYFPPEDAHGRPGFPRVLRALHDAWTNEREQVLQTAARVTERIERLAGPGSASGAAPPSPQDALRQALGELREDYDPEHGGFGRRQKFPRPPALELLLAALEREPDAELRAMLAHTLDAMALGGIHDHLGGGFHRYATEPTWSIPHFEKMLYDNAQLVGVYARAFALTGRPLYRWVVERTAAWLDDEMSHPEGGFVSAQDAEVDGEEGVSYVWSREEIEQALGPVRAGGFLSVYELVPMPEHPGFGVLRVRLPAEATLERSDKPEGAALLARFDAELARFDAERAALLARRDERRQPARDDKVLAAWNGLAIRGLVEAARALDRPAYLRRAERAARCVLARLLDDGGTLHRSYVAGQTRERGVLDDYALLADGLLALHEATGDARWRTAAGGLAEAMLARFQDPTGGGFFLTPSGSDLLVRPKPFEDHEVPSGNAAALRALQRLAAATGEDRYARAAAGTVAAAAGLLRQAPHAVPTTVAALVDAPEAPRAIAALPAAGAAVRTSAQQTGDPPELRLPRSEDHVRAKLVRRAGDPSRLLVQLAIDEGWHLNRNPASLPFLVPTTVEVRGGAAGAEIRYPEGRPFRPDFAPAAIDVYEGRVEIPVLLPDGGDPPQGLGVRFQACDATRCLPPGRTDLALESPGEAAR